MILASEAFKKATALEEEKVLQETEEMSQEIATLIEEAVSRGKLGLLFLVTRNALLNQSIILGKF